MKNMFDQFDEKIKKAKEHFANELKSIRTGRAHPSLLANITVDAYGTPTPLPHLANISTPEAKLLIIEPWDKSLVKEIEKAISASSLNLNPAVDGNILRLKLPDLTEESRKNLIKIVHEKLEQTRVAIRQARDELKKQIETRKKNGAITEDEKFKNIETLDKKTREIIAELEKADADKEEEVLTI